MGDPVWYDPSSAVRSWRRLLEQTRWQPNTRLRCDAAMPHQNQDGGLRLLVVLTVEDTRHPGVIGKVCHSRLLPMWPHERGPRAMLEVLRDELRAVAAHESDEWLVVDGSAPFDPHGEPDRPARPVAGPVRQPEALVDLVNALAGT